MGVQRSLLSLGRGYALASTAPLKRGLEGGNMDDRGFLNYLDEVGIKNQSLRITALFGYCCGFEEGHADALQDEKEKKEGEEG